MGICNMKPNPNRDSRQIPNSGLKVNGNNNNKKSTQVLEAKIVIIGASSVGKTCIANRYSLGKFDSNQAATVGAAFLEKKYQFSDGTLMKIHLWDTAGSDRFKSLGPLYYRDAHAAMIVYSIGDADSL